MDEEEVVFALGSSRMPLSIDEAGEYKDEKSVTLLEKLPAKEDEGEMVEKLLLRQAIEKLPEREKKIVILRFFRDMTQAEVARLVGVSQVQISRIESRVIENLKKNLGERA